MPGGSENDAMTFTRYALNPFQPLPLCRSGWAQTVVATVGADRPVLRSLPEDLWRVSLADGDDLVMVESRPPTWNPSDRIIMLVHGLSGCYRSNYMVRLAHKFYRRGLLVVRVNLRGSGPGAGLAALPYHSGRSDDTRTVLRALADRYPHAPVTQIGFSLGGNITLKMIGEDGAKQSGNLDSAVAVSPPADLVSSSMRLRSSGWFFDRYFVNRIRHLMGDLRSEIGWDDVVSRVDGGSVRLHDIDEHFVAPMWGFAGAMDYYHQASSLPLLPEVRIPTLILCAEDDPVVDSTKLSDIGLHEAVDLVLTPHGGHVGFLGTVDGTRSVRWMDELVLRWTLARS